MKKWIEYSPELRRVLQGGLAREAAHKAACSEMMSSIISGSRTFEETGGWFIPWNFDVTGRLIQASGDLETRRWGTVRWTVLIDKRKRTTQLRVIRACQGETSWPEEDHFDSLEDGVRFLQWTTGLRGKEYVSEDCQWIVTDWQETLTD